MENTGVKPLISAVCFVGRHDSRTKAQGVFVTGTKASYPIVRSIRTISQ